MCWADRIALLLLVLLAMVLGFLDLTGGHNLEAWVEVLWFLGTRYLLPFWLVLRVVDLILGGPARRRGTIRATLISP